MKKNEICFLIVAIPILIFLFLTVSWPAVFFYHGCPIYAIGSVIFLGVIGFFLSLWNFFKQL
jgi:hypothetical protein